MISNLGFFLFGCALVFFFLRRPSSRIESLLLEILDALEKILKALPGSQAGKAVRFIFTATFDDGHTQEEMLVLNITDVQKVRLSIQPVDAKGNAAPVDGIPQWQVSDANILDITPAADGLSADVVAKGPLTAAGTSVQVSVSADADLGAGVENITGTLDIAVIASKATSIAINADAPANQ